MKKKFRKTEPDFFSECRKWNKWRKGKKWGKLKGSMTCNIHINWNLCQFQERTCWTRTKLFSLVAVPRPTCLGGAFLSVDWPVFLDRFTRRRLCRIRGERQSCFIWRRKFYSSKSFLFTKKWSVANCGCFFSNPIFEVWDSSRQALHDSQFKETEQWTGLGRGSRSFDRGTEYKHSFSTLEGVSWGRLGIWIGRRGVLVVSGKRPGTDKLWTLCHLACQGMPWNKRWWLGGGRSGHLCLDLCPPIQTLGVCSLQTDLNSRWELQREPHNLGNHIRYTCSQHIMPEC